MKLLFDFLHYICNFSLDCNQDAVDVAKFWAIYDLKYSRESDGKKKTKTIF